MKGNALTLPYQITVKSPEYGTDLFACEIILLSDSFDRPTAFVFLTNTKNEFLQFTQVIHLLIKEKEFFAN